MAYYKGMNHYNISLILATFIGWTEEWGDKVQLQKHIYIKQTYFNKQPKK